MATNNRGNHAVETSADPVLWLVRARDFLDHRDHVLDDIHQALCDQDAERFLAAAQALKNSVGFLGGNRLMDICRHLEKMGEDETFTGAEEALMELSGAVHCLEQHLVRSLH